MRHEPGKLIERDLVQAFKMGGLGGILQTNAKLRVVRAMDIEEFRTSTYVHLETLEQLAGVCFKKPDYSKLRKEINRLQYKLKQIEDDDILIYLSRQSFTAQTTKDMSETVRATLQAMGTSRAEARQAQSGINRTPPLKLIRKEILDIELQVTQEMARYNNRKKKIDEGEQVAITSDDTKNKDTRTFDSLLADARLNHARSLEERVGRMEARINNLLVRILNQQERDEMESIVHRLRVIADGVTEFSKDCELLMAKIATKLAEPVPEVNILEDGEPPKISAIPTAIRRDNIAGENTIASQYIDSLLSLFTHELSSTKQNGHATHGDGSFVVKIFRPFLQALRNQILSYSAIDLEYTSWKEIIDIYKNGVDDADNARMHFLGILQKSTMKDTFLNICGQPLLEAIITFSETGFYKESKSALVNVRSVLEHNPPPSR